MKHSPPQIGNERSETLKGLQILLDCHSVSLGVVLYHGLNDIESRSQTGCVNLRKRHRSLIN